MAKTCIFSYVAQILGAADSIVLEGHFLLQTLYSTEIHRYLTNLCTPQKPIHNTYIHICCTSYTDVTPLTTKAKIPCLCLCE